MAASRAADPDPVQADEPGGAGSSPSVNWTNAKGADGPKLAAWITTHLPSALADPTASRRVCFWKSGEGANFYTVDALLTKFNTHVSELPDDVWVAVHRRPDGTATHYGDLRKVATIDLKPCEHCGEPIPLYHPGGTKKHPKYYAEARYCSTACSWTSLKVSGRLWR